MGLIIALQCLGLTWLFAKIMNTKFWAQRLEGGRLIINAIPCCHCCCPLCLFVSHCWRPPRKTHSCKIMTYMICFTRFYPSFLSMYLVNKKNCLPTIWYSLESTNCAVMTTPLGPLGSGVGVFAPPGIIDHSSLTLVDSTTLPMTAPSPQSSPAHGAETPPVGVTTILYSQQGEGRLSTAPDLIFSPSHVFITGYSHKIKTVCLPRIAESLHFLR